jgi:hypothetical protein
MAKHYVRDRGMAGLGWIGHVGLGQDEEYYGTDDAGNDIYVSDSTGGYVDENGISLTPVGSVYNDAGLNLSTAAPITSTAFGPPAAEGPPTPAQVGASAGTGQTYYGTDSKGNDVWVNSQGKYVNQDGLPVTPSGSINVEGGGTYNPATGARSGTSSLGPATGIAAGALPAMLAPGPAPRVAVPAPASSASFLTASSIIPGVSNLMIIGGVGLLAVLLAGKK